ncbi:MAG: hypothetical protein GTN36_04585, partial [Candidatus Aenigmarchaeota archaeon]|nr:hypothetical protein [Candidatus Aenigmarchaeota archaeon]
MGKKKNPFFCILYGNLAQLKVDLRVQREVERMKMIEINEIQQTIFQIDSNMNNADFIVEHLLQEYKDAIYRRDALKEQLT